MAENARRSVDPADQNDSTPRESKRAGTSHTVTKRKKAKEVGHSQERREKNLSDPKIKS